jgi:8-oxo-dGTP diphosphatase
MLSLPTISVVCAVIKKDESYFIAQRSAKMKMPLKWEFPGGKVEQGESNAHAIIREIKEEFDIDVEVIQEHPYYLHDYPTFTLKLTPIEVTIKGGKMVLKEHAASKWVPAKDLSTFDFSEGDINIVKALYKRDVKGNLPS